MGLGSCEKYLDIKRTNTQTPISTVADLQLLLDNPAMNADFPSDLILSSDDYYVTDDGYTSTTITDQDRLFYIWSSMAIRISSDQWQRAYGIIYNANLVLEYADKFKKDGGQNQFELDKERGSALFFRAYAHWWIAQQFAKPYLPSTATQNPGIPLRLASDINEKSIRGNLEQTYNQILQDLQESVGLLQNSVVVSSRPSKAAAYAMLARVYLSMENYEQALNNANAALEINNTLLDFNTLSKTAAAPFTIYNKEVLFHSTSINSALLEPGTSIPIAKVNPELVTSYNNNDLRGQLFIKPNTGTFASTYRFVGNYNGSVSSVLFNGLAVDELYLTRAECYSRLGNVALAMGDLNTLLRTRWVNGTYVDMTALNADDALVKVLTERRKELLMRGLRWMDLRRLNRDTRFSRTLNRTIQGTTYTLPPNDIRYTLLIPVPVIQYADIQQNQR